MRRRNVVKIKGGGKRKNVVGERKRKGVRESCVCE